MQQPFSFRGPIRDHSHFYNRASELKEIIDFIKVNQSVAVVAPRKVGKTSLLFQLMRHSAIELPELLPNHLFVYQDCELFSTESERSILSHFARSTARALLGHRHASLEQSLQQAIHFPTYLSFERVLYHLTRQNWKPVFVLDEFQRLETALLSPHFFNFLHAVAGHQLVTFIVATTRPLIQLTFAVDNDKIHASPFFLLFAQMNLRLFSEEVARDYLTYFGQKAAIHFSDTMIDFIMELAGSHPFLLQVAAYCLLKIKGEEAMISKENQLDIAQMFYDEVNPYWTYIWQKLTHQEKKSVILFSLVAAASPPSIQLLNDIGAMRKSVLNQVELLPMFEQYIQTCQLPAMRRVPPITLDLDAHEAVCNGRMLTLTETEFTLLNSLVQNAGKLTTYQQLESHIWQENYIGNSERLKAIVKTLRRALGSDSTCIKNVRGLGYKFVPTA